MDVSLYQLAVDTESPHQPLLVSPVTLKSLMGALIEVLIEQQLPATFLVKLPPGKVWQADLDRYRKQVSAPHTIYVCNSHQTPMESLSSQSTGISRIFPIPLVSGSQLIREYFLLVLSAQFCGVIVSHRSRSFKSLPTETSKNKPQMLALCAFDPQTVQRVLEGIKQTISTVQTPVLAHSEKGASVSRAEVSPTLENLLDRWDSLFTLPKAPDPLLLNQLLVKQVQQQEEIWRRASRVKNSDPTSSFLKQSEEGGGSKLATDIHQEAWRLKDEFLSHVVQELRMPLTNMKTALTLLESPHLKPTQRQRYLHLLQTECDRQNSLIAGLLELLQLDRAREQESLQPLKLADIVPGIVSTYQPLAQEKGIQLGYTVPDKLPLVSCLETWLRQIVINLLHNSIKYTPEGGRAWVRAKQQGEYVQLEFHDTGIGIAAGEIPKIFDRFYRGRPAMGEDIAGAGLGLTIVQQLLLRCGGSISVSSNLGDGSTFKVLLPVDHQTPT